MKQKVAVYLICFLCASVFILSAYLKLWPIESFEYKIASTGFFSWKLTAIIARLIISFEFALGFLLLFAYRLTFTIISSISLLLAFSFYLLLTLGNESMSSDCGCMGDGITISSEVAILKNLLMIVMLTIAYFYRFEFGLRFKGIPLALMTLIIIGIFIIEPVNSQFNIHKEFNRPYRLNLEPIYTSKFGDIVERPRRDIRHDKLLLVFLSANCEHCRLALKKISAIKSRAPSLPMYLFINGDDNEISDLLSKSSASQIPHSRLNGPAFIQTAGLKLPLILFYNNGTVENRVDYLNLNQEALEIWLEK